MAKEHVDTIIFSQGGLNTDDDLLMLSSGDARYRENIIISDDSNFNVLTNVLGNTLKNNNTSFTYPSGDLRVIGFVENKEDKAGIFFVYSSSGEHSIIQYKSDIDTLEYILRGGSSVIAPIGIGNILNFDIDSFVDAGIIGNEEDKYLIWTDNYNEPRMINILMAINFTADSGTPIFNSITTELLSFYKKPYTGSILVTGSSYDSTFQFNNIKGKIFQFSVRLKYYDNTYSPLSPYSNIINTTEEIATGFIRTGEIDNRIQVDLYFDNELDLVNSYQLLFRNLDIGDGVASNWYVYDTYLYTSIGSKSLYFYNDKNSGVISEDEVLRYYDYIPLKSDHLEIIDSNRVVFGGVEEGFDNIDYENLSEWNVSLAEEQLAIDVTQFGDNSCGIEYYNFDLNLYDPTNPTIIFSGFTELFNEDFYYFFYLREKVSISDHEYFITSSYGITQTEAYVQIKDFIDSLGYDLTVTAAATSLTITVNAASLQSFAIYFYVLKNSILYKTLKTGAIYKFGIVYHYDGRIGSVQSTDDLILSTSYFDEITVSTKTEYVLNANLTINHLAPLGATTYQIVSFGNNISYYEQYCVYTNFADILDDAAEFTMYSDGLNTIIRRDEMINRFRTVYNDGIEYGYDFQVGDLVRIIGYMQVFPNPDIDVICLDEKYEFEILGINSSEILISNAALNSLSTIYSSSLFILIEIVQLKNQSDIISQEFSQVFSIDSNRYHSSNFQDQTALLPAIIRITDDFSDCWKSRQVFVNSLNQLDYNIPSTFGGCFALMEKPKVSLLYNSYPLNQGRFNAVDENSHRDYYNKIRWGGKYLDDSGYNFISVFKAEDERILDDRNGKINKIQQIGDTLKVYQERKTNSFYLKTTSSTSADGSQTYVFNDAVMSEVRQSVFDYGCTHFTSFVNTVREAFYFDIINAVVIKDTPGGPVVISDQKMHTYFKLKSKQILEYTAGTVLILGGYDEDLDLYLLTFIDPNDTESEINETIGYYLPSDRWISFYSYMPEYYGKISGYTALMFCNGMLYLQNSNSIRNNFCGTQFTSIVDVHSTANAPLIKEFDSIEIVSTGIWSPNQNTDIEINLPDFMQSRLLEEKFKRQEGIYCSEFLKDALVDNGLGTKTFVRQQLHSGRTLRGHEIRVRLRNDDTIESNLRLVIIKGSISK